MTTNPIQPATASGLRIWERRSDGITLVAAYHFVVAVLFLLGAIIMAIPTLILGVITLAEAPDAAIGLIAVGFIATVLMLLCMLNLAVGYGLWRVQSWACTAAIVLAIIGLLFIPIGTIFGALIWWYLLQPEVTAEFDV